MPEVVVVPHPTPSCWIVLNWWDFEWIFIKWLEAPPLHPTYRGKKRLSRILLNSSPSCKFFSDQVSANLEHCFFYCNLTKTVGNQVLTLCQTFCPGITPSQVLRLELHVDRTKETPIIWIVAQFLINIWEARVKGKMADLFRTRSDLESKVNLLRETRYNNLSLIITEMLHHL